MVLSPEIATLSMSGFTFLVAVNALPLKWLRLPRPGQPGAATVSASPYPGGRQEAVCCFSKRPPYQ